MMGRTHAISGTLAFGGATLAYRFNAGEIFAGLVITTAAALLPDLDHHKATITKTYGPVTKIAHWFVGLAFGPHRHGTHSIFFCVIVGIGAQMLIMWPNIGTKIGLLVLMSITTGSLVRLFRIKGWWDDLLPPVIYALIIFVVPIFWPLDLSMIPFALAFGSFVHIAGDCLTDKGCPIFWPISSKKFGIGIFTTGKRGESIITILFLLGIVAVIVIHVLKAYGVIK